MPTLEELENKIERLNLKIQLLETKLATLLHEEKPKRRGPHRRSYDTWLSIHILHDNGMNTKNICDLHKICYKTCVSYLKMPEEQAKLLPRDKELQQRIKTYKFKLELKYNREK